MKKTLNWIFGILLLVMFIICGLQFYCLHKQTEPECIQIHDTVTIHTDSIVTKTMWKTKWDTIKEIHYKDTVLYDTIYLDIEHKVDSFTIKKDSLSITEKIKYHGYKAVIDSIELNYELQYTVQPKKQKKIGLVWNIGPYVGYGINFNNGQYYFSPEVGIGGSIGIGGIIK